MALIEANRLTVTLPGGPDDPPGAEVATQRIRTWLHQRYGYPPPLAELEGHGWSDAWEVAGARAPGWRFEAVIPRHLGPAPAGSEAAEARAAHPANVVRVPPVARSRSSAAARSGATRPERTRSGRTRSGARGGAAARRPVADPVLRHRLDTLFPHLEVGTGGPGGSGPRPS